MATLAIALQQSLEDHGVKVTPINTNPVISSKIKSGRFRKLIEWLIFVFSLRKVSGNRAVIVISSSGDYFFAKAMPSMYACKLFKCKSILDFVGGGHSGNAR